VNLYVAYLDILDVTWHGLMHSSEIEKKTRAYRTDLITFYNALKSHSRYFSLLPLHSLHILPTHPITHAAYEAHSYT